MHQTAASSLIFGQEKVLPYVELDMAHPTSSRQICLKADKCLVYTILNTSDAMGHPLYCISNLIRFFSIFISILDQICFSRQLINEELISFMCLMLYDDFWTDATYVLLCIAWMQILDSHIPTVQQRVPKWSQMLTTTCQLPIAVHPLFFAKGIALD